MIYFYFLNSTNTKFPILIQEGRNGDLSNENNIHLFGRKKASLLSSFSAHTRRNFLHRQDFHKRICFFQHTEGKKK